MKKNQACLTWAIGLASSLLLVSCGKQALAPQHAPPLFLELPRNTAVYDDIAPIIYDALHQELINTGFTLADNNTSAYTLRLAIDQLEPTDKLISPDIVLFATTMRISVNLKLLNHAGNIVHTKTFSCATLVSKPLNPLLSSDFTNISYQELAARTARIIAHHLLRQAATLFPPES